MSHQLGRVVSEVLLRYFGEIVQKVGNDLFSSGSRAMSMIIRSTGLPRSQVIESLRTLVKYDLASFEPSANDLIADYRLIPENVLLLIRYPRYLVWARGRANVYKEIYCKGRDLHFNPPSKYLLQMKTKYGSEAELLVEELLQMATATAHVLLFTIANKYKDDKEKNISIITLKDTFISLATAGYIQQAPVAEMKEGSEVPNLVPVATIVPELDSRVLLQAMAAGSLADVKDNVYWKVNYDRFHLDFRDDVMIKAITRRIDENAGELMRLMLEQMYLSSPPWAAESNPAPAPDARDPRERPLLLLAQHAPHYARVLEENGCGFVRRVGSAGGGAWVVRAARAAEQLACALLDHTVTERLGDKAARIFRLVRAKKYIEEEDIQKYAMLPNKECKELTYKLLEEHFISVQPMRKAASAGGLAKAIYLYHIDMHDVSLTCMQMCYRALHNTLRRAAHERGRHARLLDKRRRVRSIVHGMRARGEPDHNVADVEETITPPEHMLLQGVEKRIKQLSCAELELDKSIFILKWYLSYS